MCKLTAIWTRRFIFYLKILDSEQNTLNMYRKVVIPCFWIVIKDIYSSAARHLDFLIVNSKHSSVTKFWIKGWSNSIFTITINFYQTRKMLWNKIHSKILHIKINRRNFFEEILYSNDFSSGCGGSISSILWEYNSKMHVTGGIDTRPNALLNTPLIEFVSCYLLKVELVNCLNCLHTAVYEYLACVQRLSTLRAWKAVVPKSIPTDSKCDIKIYVSLCCNCQTIPFISNLFFNMKRWIGQNHPYMN